MILACVLVFVLLVSGPSWASIKVGNQLALTPTYYSEDLGDGTTQWSVPIREELDLTAKPTHDLKFKLSPVVYSDPVSPSVSEQYSFDLLEANVDYRVSDFRARVGMNSVAWGVTDVFNPLDVVSARRYTDFLNIEKRGVPSVILSYDDGTWLAEGIFIPQQQISILPGPYSRWLPRDLGFVGGNATALEYQASNATYVYDGPAIADNCLQDDFGFRLEHHGSGLDLTAIYFQGPATAPAMTVPAVFNSEPISNNNINTVYATRIELEPVYYLRRTGGAGAVITLSQFIIRLATAYSDQIDQNPNWPTWEADYVVGLEKNFAIGKEGTLTALLQATEAQHGDPPGNYVTSIGRVFDQSYMLGLRYQVTGNWTMSSVGLFDSRYQDGFAEAKVEHRLADGLTSALTYDWIDGSSGTPLGTYRRNKRISLGVVATF